MLAGWIDGPMPSLQRISGFFARWQPSVIVCIGSTPAASVIGWLSLNLRAHFSRPGRQVVDVEVIVKIP